MIRILSRNFFRFLFALLIISLITGKSSDGQESFRVAVFPFQIHAKENLDYLQDAIFVTISGRLMEDGDIEIVDRGALTNALPSPETTEITEQLALSIAKDLDADYAVVGTLTKVGEFVNVDARLVGIETSGPPLRAASQYRGLEAAMEGLADFANRTRRRIALASAAPQEKGDPQAKSTISSLYEKVLEGVRGEKPPPPQPQRGLETFQTLSTFLRGVDVGDVDGDNLNEIVLIDKRNLWIYKVTGGRLRLYRKIEGHRSDDFLTLDVADLNQNGFSEIIVSNMRAGILRSFILEFEKRRIKKIIDRQKWFFRVIENSATGRTLVGQKMAVDRRPIGKIHSFSWTGKTFHPSKKTLTKKEIPVFSFNFGDLDGRGEQSVIYVDYHDQLRVLTQEGAYRWESRESYGGTDIFYSVGSQGSNVGEKRVYIPPRVLVADMDGDGVSEVIVSRNTFKLNMVEKLRVYDRARIVNLTWQGMGFLESWETPEIAGYISDYQLKDIDNDGKDEIVITAVSKGVLRSGASSSLLVYELF
jgi:TolB-like protein